MHRYTCNTCHRMRRAHNPTTVRCRRCLTGHNRPNRKAIGKGRKVAGEKAAPKPQRKKRSIPPGIKG